ncbi:YxeA family protein [Lactococcus ileimucosae]|uniref:YxeA family protein n=1 Tax=Lactococcus ileimucosae TaxID=2941329 RepID=UPI0035199E46
MKKVLFGLLAFVVIIGGLGYGWYKTSYGGAERYVKITEDGREKTIKADSGERFINYEYKLTSYDKKGNEKEVSFTAQHNLRKNAYLKLTDNKVKGITSWEEVQEKDLPSKAKEKLN